jgi:hypothetical protein
LQLIIDILDVNDNPPEFIDKSHRVAVIKENAPNSTKLNLKFAVVDPDNGENSKTAYKIPWEGSYTRRTKFMILLLMQ